MKPSRMLRFSLFRSELVAAQSQRGYMPIEGADTPDWRTYEMLVMWKTVNRMRVDGHEKPPVPFSDIEDAERQASGHSDYTKKFALYCSELVDK